MTTDNFSVALLPPAVSFTVQFQIQKNKFIFKFISAFVSCLLFLVFSYRTFVYGLFCFINLSENIIEINIFFVQCLKPLLQLQRMRAYICPVFHK